MRAAYADAIDRLVGPLPQGITHAAVEEVMRDMLGGTLDHLTAEAFRAGAREALKFLASPAEK